jgi:sugar O-acyltransferase (sialic acid O-acetyltransferase NeuD family)
MSLPIIVLGGGGHAKVLIDALLLQLREIIGYTDPDEKRKTILCLSRLGDDKKILEYDPMKLVLVNGVGSVSSMPLRKLLYEQFRTKDYCFERVIHPSAVISTDVRLGEGVQIMAGAVVQAGSSLGANTIINTGAIVDHDCDIGSHVHIAPGVTLSGTVRIEEGVHVGTGAKIIQGLVIGAGSLVGAGSVIIKNVPPGVTVVGVPGRIIRHHEKKNPGVVNV